MLSLVRPKDPKLNGRYASLGEIAGLGGRVLLFNVDTQRMTSIFHANELEVIEAGSAGPIPEAVRDLRDRALTAWPPY